MPAPEERVSTGGGTVPAEGQAPSPGRPGLGARVRLADYPATAADLRILERSRLSRTARALLTAVAVPPVALVAFLIPPHGETLFLAIGLGIYMIYREATTRYVVRSFAGTCPRCGHSLALKPGSRLTSARSVPCYGCHFHPTIEVTERPEIRSTPG